MTARSLTFFFAFQSLTTSKLYSLLFAFSLHQRCQAPTPSGTNAVKMIWFRLSSFVFLFALLQTVTASHGSMAEMPSPSSAESLMDTELTSSLLNGQIHQPEVYSRAVTILETLETAPSCHRVATLTLINSCQSLERSASTEVALYETREEYATKLAMCELSGAKASISSICANFIPSSKTCRKNRSNGFFRRSQQTEDVPGEVCYPEVSRHQVRQCISALHSKPQWWTSYSNALQNVVVVCQASRSAIEKGKLSSSMLTN